MGAVGRATVPVPTSTAASIDFVSGSSTQTAKVTNGHYSLQLSNRQNYQVTIHYALPIGASTCAAGTLVLQAVGDITQNWSC